ncbi:tetratricopeptide repeat protein [Azospirillum sp. B510]|uniref:tetratricopeptide repeat protein n=1 Tax=Azospirillum sp. (strain B510) TaxID=137722 RepID=UPI0005A87454|nr:tetratricopeptide repeat protein [Azospirillum sp. B510]
MSTPQASQAQSLVERAMRAMSRHAAGDLPGAEEDYRAVVEQVQHIGLYAGFGALLLQTRRLEEAARWLRRTLALAPSRDAAIENLGALLHERGQSGAAETWLRRRLALSRDAPGAMANLGIVLTATGRVAEAIDWLGMACRQQPDNPGHRYNLAVALDKADDRIRALALYRHLADVEPHSASVRFERGNQRLLAGDWARGWEDCESRALIPSLSPPVKWATRIKRWDGTPMPDGVLALCGEQGIDDVLMFCRFLPLAAARVKRIILQVHAPLVPLLQGQIANITVQPFGDIAHADAALPLMSLAKLLSVTPGT